MNKKIVVLFGIIAFVACNSGNGSNKNKISLREELETALSDPTIDTYYKDTYKEGKLIIIENNDDKMLSVTDSIFSKNSKRDFFYFMVFTKSMNGSDGFYAEALDVSSHEFVLHNTAKFAEYFSEKSLLTDTDMDNWVGFVGGELFLSNEATDLPAITKDFNDLKNKLSGNVKKENPVIREVITIFNNKLDLQLKSFIEDNKDYLR